jgi:hypothetical protein
MAYEIKYDPPYTQMAASKLLDGDLHRVTLLDQTPEPGLPYADQAASDHLDSGRAIDPTFLPSTVLIPGGHGAITDYGGTHGIRIVSSEFREIVEALEPERHQFFPVRLVDKRKQHLADHFIWIVCNRLDGVDREQTTLELWKGVLWRPYTDRGEGQVMPSRDRIPAAKLVFNASQIGDAHFWRDKFLLSRMLFCSEAARMAMADAELTGVRLKPIETV